MFHLQALLAFGTIKKTPSMFRISLEKYIYNIMIKWGYTFKPMIGKLGT